MMKTVQSKGWAFMPKMEHWKTNQTSWLMAFPSTIGHWCEKFNPSFLHKKPLPSNGFFSLTNPVNYHTFSRPVTQAWLGHHPGTTSSSVGRFYLPTFTLVTENNLGYDDSIHKVLRICRKFGKPSLKNRSRLTTSSFWSARKGEWWLQTHLAPTTRAFPQRTCKW